MISANTFDMNTTTTITNTTTISTISTISTTTTTTTNPNLFRDANENELALNEQACQLIIKINEEDVRTNLEYMEHFKIKSSKMDKIYCLIFNFVTKLNILLREKTLPVKRRDKSRDKKIKKTYNTCLNLLFAVVSEDSILQNLLPVDENLNFMRKRIPVQRARIDFVNSAFGEKVGKAKFILHTCGPNDIGGGRTEFDSGEDCLSAMRACIENSMNWEDIIYYQFNELISYGCFEFNTSDTYGNFLFALKIKFPGTEYWIPSYSSKLKHILCSGNPPKSSKYSYDDPKFQSLYPLYAEFLGLVRKQIIIVIQNSHSNPDCGLVVIQCCRTSPECNGKNYVHKVRSGYINRITCCECYLDLCINGCGRVYHGNTPCDISLDEASEEIIRNTTKRCPNDRCGVNIHKVEGCNHMTCSRCSTEFCYTCGLEIPKDIHGNYRTDLHFNPGRLGIGRVGGCDQFEH